MDSMPYSTSDTFSTVINISAIVDKSKFIFLLFIDVFHANRGAVKKV